ACASASSRVTLPSRRPNVPAEAPLEVASAWKPRPARSLAEPASQGFAMTNARDPACRASNRCAFSDWLAIESPDGSLHAVGDRAGRPVPEEGALPRRRRRRDAEADREAQSYPQRVQPGFKRNRRERQGVRGAL